MEPRAQFVESHRPPGGRRSSKRDRIVNYFLGQEGHLTADELADAMRGAGYGISRATVYRTLQWMVDAGIARKVDFGEGRARFEHAYRHPRHFHLICRSCSQSFEFLSSDVESLLEEIAEDRGFDATERVVQIYGTCDACKAGRRPSGEPVTAELLFARDALRIAIATERSGLEFYRRAARLTKDARGGTVFRKLAGEEKEHLSTLQARYAELLQQDTRLESWPTFLFFKGAADGLFAAGADELSAGVDDQEALRIGIRCERSSYRFFRRYGERFEDSEGKRIFLEFAREERDHLELLIREYRALRARQSSAPAHRRRRRANA